MEISEKSKYQRWYEAIIESGRDRTISVEYTEVHHILPRSCGGSDDPENLVRLDYRRHFLAHWLLTKFYRGLHLRKMQRAMIAMTMPLNGGRIISGWQFDVAKRAVKDLALTPTQRRNRVIAKRSAVIAQEYARGAVLAEAKALAAKEYLSNSRPFWKLDLNKLPPPPPPPAENGGERKRTRRRRPRPGKRWRAPASRGSTNLST